LAVHLRTERGAEATPSGACLLGPSLAQQFKNPSPGCQKSVHGIGL